MVKRAVVKKKAVKKISKKIVKANSKKVIKKIVRPQNAGVLTPKEVRRGERASGRFFIFFSVLFGIFAALYAFTDFKIYEELFFVLALCFGAIAVSLFISLLAYFIYERMKFKFLIKK